MRLGSARKYPHTLACDKRLRPLFPVARRRRGILAFELLLILPIILLLILAMVQFSLTLHARQQLVAVGKVVA